MHRRIVCNEEGMERLGVWFRQQLTMCQCVTLLRHTAAQ